MSLLAAWSCSRTAEAHPPKVEVEDAGVRVEVRGLEGDSRDLAFVLEGGEAGTVAFRSVSENSKAGVLTWLVEPVDPSIEAYGRWMQVRLTFRPDGSGGLHAKCRLLCFDDETQALKMSRSVEGELALPTLDLADLEQVPVELDVTAVLESATGTETVKLVGGGMVELR